MKRILLVVMIWGLTALSAQALDVDKMREVLRLIGYDKAISLTSFQIKNAKGMVEGADATFEKAWDAVADELFVGDRLFEALVVSTAPNFDDAEYDELISYFSKGLGRRVTDMEDAAHTESGQAELEELGPIMLADIAEDYHERLEIIEEMLDSLGVEEKSLASALNFGFAIMSGMASTGQLPATFTETQMLAVLQAQADDIRKNAKERALISAAYVYRDLNDQDLKAYVGFLSGPLGRKLYREMGQKSDDLMSQLVRRFGREVMVRMGVKEL